MLSRLFSVKCRDIFAHTPQGTLARLNQEVEGPLVIIGTVASRGGPFQG
jgi:hypothetical protein